MAASSSLSATGFSSSFHGSWGTSIAGEDYSNMVAKAAPIRVRVGKPLRSGPMMGNVNEGKGIFAPLVVITRNIVGKKRFNQLRGKAIALHSQVSYPYLKPLFDCNISSESSKLLAGEILFGERERYPGKFYY